MKADLKEKIKNRKLVPNFNGRKHIPGKFDDDGNFIGGHIYIDSENLTDERALELLEGKWLTKADFKVLPQAPKKEQKVAFTEVLAALDSNDTKTIKRMALDLGLTKGSVKLDEAIFALEQYVDENEMK